MEWRVGSACASLLALAFVCASAEEGPLFPSWLPPLPPRVGACVGAAACQRARVASVSPVSVPPGFFYDPKLLPTLVASDAAAAASCVPLEADVVADLSCAFVLGHMTWHSLRDCALANFDAYEAAERLLAVPPAERGPLAVLHSQAEARFVGLFLGLAAAPGAATSSVDTRGAGEAREAREAVEEPAAAAAAVPLPQPQAAFAVPRPWPYNHSVCYALRPNAVVVYPRQSLLYDNSYPPRALPATPPLAARFRAAALRRAGVEEPVPGAGGPAPPGQPQQPAGPPAAAAAAARAAANRTRTLLVVVRSPPAVRHFVNQAALDAGLRACLPASRGWAVASYLGREGPADTVRLFASADAVVGAHGAGMGNTAFCRPGAAVVELAVRLQGSSGRGRSGGVAGLWNCMDFAKYRGGDLRWACVGHALATAAGDAAYWARARAAPRGVNAAIQHAPSLLLPPEGVAAACAALRRLLGPAAAAGGG